MDKIKMKMPLVELDGDEMTRVLWQWIKDILIIPFVDLKSEYYDLGLIKRDETNDQITLDAANAIAKYGVGVKCATITPNAQRVDEYKLKKMWLSPNGTLRAILDGTIFRVPVTLPCITPAIPTWTKPITIARHAHGDIYKNFESYIEKDGTAELVINDIKGEKRLQIHNFTESGGISMGMYNTDLSIRSFAVSCFEYALATKQDLWFATKDTISKTYDHRFKDIFSEIYEASYAKQFEEAGIEYFYTLIDDAVARVIRSEGGYIWACKNYDGDVMSDMVATVFGSLAMMTSVLVSPSGAYEYEAAHGTVTRHYYKHLEGESTSTNPVATIYAWSGAFRKRGELDNLPELIAYADALEESCLDTISEGTVTKDLVALYSGDATINQVNSADFLEAIATRLRAKISV